MRRSLTISLFFFSSRRRHTRLQGDWSSDVCSSDLGVEIRWKCDPGRVHDQTPAEATFRFPNGLADFLGERIKDLETVTPQPFAGRRSEERRVGKGVDLGGRRIIKKKKKK